MVELEEGEYKTAEGSKCPVCDHPLPVAAGINHNREPEPGDVTLCIWCAAYLQFNDDLSLKIFPLDELLDLPDETRLLLTRGRQAIKVVHEIDEDEKEES